MKKMSSFQNSRGRKFTWRFVEDIEGHSELLMSIEGTISTESAFVGSAKEAKELALKLAEKY